MFSVLTAVGVFVLCIAVLMMIFKFTGKITP